MMDIQFRDYQLDCLDKVMSKNLILGNMLRLLWFSDIRLR
jgi:hypothetical protein